MFNTLKKLFGKRVEEASVATADYRPASSAPKPASRAPGARAASARPEAHARPTPTVDASRPTPPPVAGSRFAVSLRAVIAKLPPELAGRVRQNDVGEAELFVPVQKVHTQLATGAVRISFGELRQTSPPGTFSPENDRDRTMVDLPLAEILSRVNPGLIARRPSQKVIEVPPEVTGPFSGQTRVTISKTPSLKQNESAKPAAVPQDASHKRNGFSTSPESTQAPRPAAPAAPIAPAVPIPAMRAAPVTPISPLAPTPPAVRVTPAVPVRPIGAPPLATEPAGEQPIFRRTTPAPTQSVQPAQPVQPARPIFSPIVPTAPPAAGAVPSGDPDAIPISAALRDLAPSRPAVAQPQPAPVTPIEQPAPIRFNPIGVATPAAPQLAPSTPITFTSTAPAPTLAAPVVPAITEETKCIAAPLKDLSQGWPDPVKREIDLMNKPGALVGLPYVTVEAAMKAGKLAFSWAVVRSWIRPPVANGVSEHDAVLLELPLKIVTPLFLAELRTPRAAKKISISEEIPDLFANGSKPQALTPTSTPPAQSTVPAMVDVTQESKSMETNYFQKEGSDNPNDPALQIKKGAKIGTSFLQRYATPNDIVGKAASLPGIGGALIALPDGLLVASKVSADVNADTMAGFLPAIFTKVSQTTKELRMGDLNNLNFTVGNIPWKIFRVGAIYFAAFGVAGQPMPTAQLAGLAAELDRKPKQ